MGVEKRRFLALAVTTVAVFLLGVLVALIPDKGGDFLGSSIGLCGTLALGLIFLSSVLLLLTLFYGFVTWLNRGRRDSPAAEGSEDGTFVKHYRGGRSGLVTHTDGDETYDYKEDE